jgi:hypothetical protein
MSKILLNLNIFLKKTFLPKLKFLLLISLYLGGMPTTTLPNASSPPEGRYELKQLSREDTKTKNICFKYSMNNKENFVYSVSPSY